MINGSTFSALIFDCDGVLVNSEQIVQAIELRHLERCGLIYSPEDFANRFTGTADDEFFALLNEDAIKITGKNLPGHFKEDLMSAVGLAIRKDLVEVEGARSFASSMTHVKAVASSSGHHHLTEKLSMTGLLALFGEHVYSADAVDRGKPAPDVFLHAAASLRVDPAACVVIEDSLNGVVAAKRAGMRVIGFTGGGHCLPGHGQKLAAAGADHVVEHFKEIQIW